MSLIELQSLGKIFRRGDEEIHALRDVNLEISQGDFLAITGPSGGGKSTLLYILGLLDRQSSGGYLLEGSSTSHLSDDARSALRNQLFGFVFQSFHLLPTATALRNVMMPLVYAANYGKRLTDEEMHAKAKLALERVGLGERLNHVPNQLSGGQRQRVAIARALVNSPKILLADEPTGNLDSKIGAEVMALFQELNKEGATILLVTHDAQIAQGAHQQLHLRDGRVESYVR
jgi:putative ABC transport system ATP-binding protein